jgi:cyanobactin maturation PatA/PatG family protease
MDASGEPLVFSNWGRTYQLQGILAPGANIRGARAGGGTALGTGTSYATAIVSGFAALLLSLQLQKGQEPNPRLVREAILRTALGCDYQATTDCRRLLAGRLDVKGAVSFITRETDTMSELVQTPSSAPLSEASGEPVNGATRATPPAAFETLAPGEASAVRPAACSCQCGAGSPQFVYALGQIGYDLAHEARLDSVVQKMGAHFGATSSERLLAFDPRQMLSYLDHHPWDAAAIEWTLNVDGNPIYALRPQGPFAADTYKELRRFLRERLDEGAERLSVPGLLAGRTTLLIGQSVPVLVPELRGMYSWTTRALVESVVGPAPAEDAAAEAKEHHERKRAGVHNFLERVYHELRNLGVAPLERAMNFSATNAFQIERIYESVLKEKERVELDHISATRSPICRPHSDCWDVELTFFFPERPVQTVRKIYRFAVDVSDVVPVTVGKTRSWFVR